MANHNNMVAEVKVVIQVMVDNGVTSIPGAQVTTIIHTVAIPDNGHMEITLIITLVVQAMMVTSRPIWGGLVLAHTQALVTDTPVILLLSKDMHPGGQEDASKNPAVLTMPWTMLPEGLIPSGNQ
mmetsp:Transcript_101422/g.293359  ORF Transcript_101422/g.293359 Transcript_101422/m.293359 type:complete len:125 (+) Transcript_101422:100-474(+)